MSEFYEEAASDCLSLAKVVQLPEGSPWADFYEEMASELLSMANASR